LLLLLLITPVEERPNSSRFLRIEFFRKDNCDKFVKDFDHIPLFAGCTVDRYNIRPNKTLPRNPHGYNRNWGILFL
jgi:hypothetical protein